LLSTSRLRHAEIELGLGEFTRTPRTYDCVRLRQRGTSQLALTRKVLNGAVSLNARHLID
jgi:hypothetical protein